MTQNSQDIDQVPEEAEVTRLLSLALDESVEHLDAATLSRLNQARQKAMESRPSPMQRLWLPISAAAFASLAIAIALPLLKPAGPETPALPTVEDAYYSVQEDLELVEDLDLVLWLMEDEDHAS